MKKNISIQQIIVTTILSILIATSIIVGNSYVYYQGSKGITENTVQIIKSIIWIIALSGISFAFFNIAYNILYKCIKIERTSLFFQNKKSKWKFYDIAFFVISLGWIPYLLAYYPGLVMGDTGAQLSMFFHIDNGVSQSVKLISNSQFITTHHPVIHTVMLGYAMKIGRAVFGSDNAGLYIYTIVQVITCIAILSAAVVFVGKCTKSLCAYIISLVFFTFCPVFPRYAFLASKDSFFASFLLLFTILIADWIFEPEKYERSKFRVVFFIVIAVFVCLFRQNGILAVLLSASLLFALKNRKESFRKLKISFVIIFVFIIGVNHFMLPALKITKGSVREGMSVMFQQTARYVKYHEKDITKKEKKAIEKVLDYKHLSKKYDPVISDPVKNTFNKNATSKDLSEYMKTWFSMFFKNPKVYISAYIYNYYGYLYPNPKGIIDELTNEKTRVKKKTFYTRNLSEHFAENRLKSRGFNIEHLDKYKDLSLMLDNSSSAVFECSAYYSWIVLFIVGFLISKKMYKKIIISLPALSILFTCFISPVNGLYYFRYVYPLALILPVLVAILYVNCEKNCEKDGQIC